MHLSNLEKEVQLKIKGNLKDDWSTIRADQSVNGLITKKGNLATHKIRLARLATPNR